MQNKRMSARSRYLEKVELVRDGGGGESVGAGLFGIGGAMKLAQMIKTGNQSCKMDTLQGTIPRKGHAGRCTSGMAVGWEAATAEV